MFEYQYDKMKEKALSKFRQLEGQRKEVMELYKTSSPAQLRFNPAPGQWNMLQVMKHIILAEKQSVMYIKRKIAKPENNLQAGIGSKFRHAILRIALFLPLKFKAPKIAEVSEKYPDFEEMKTEWDAIRDDLKSIIENSDHETLRRAIYRHPRAGMLNIKQALEFFEAHIKHHQKQVGRIRGSAEFPK